MPIKSEDVWKALYSNRKLRRHLQKIARCHARGAARRVVRELKEVRDAR